MWPRTALLTTVLLATILQSDGGDAPILRIGILATMGEGKPPRYREIGPSELNQLVHQFTGLRSITLQGLDAFTAARQLEKRKWDLGVFTGIEFAWAQKRYPDLRPLMLAVTQESDLRAVLTVRKGSLIKGFADLKGQEVSILESELVCRLFTDKNVPAQPRNTFAKFFQAPTGQDALTDVLSGKVKAAIVDTPTLKHFQELYPGRYMNLTILARSPAFPPPVVVYRQDSLPDTLLMKFRNGMLGANKSEKGRVALQDFGILRFQEVPGDFQKTIADIAGEFPPPQGVVRKTASN